MDTSGWYALIDSKDPGHQSVFDVLQEHRNQLVTSNYIFDETLTLARYRLGFKIALKFGEQMRSGALARIERVSPKDEQAAWKIFTQYSDKSFSFTDCTSFAFCERLKLRSCIALDADFLTFGLRCIP